VAGIPAVTRETRVRFRRAEHWFFDSRYSILSSFPDALGLIFDSRYSSRLFPPFIMRRYFSSISFPNCIGKIYLHSVHLFLDVHHYFWSNLSPSSLKVPFQILVTGTSIWSFFIRVEDYFQSLISNLMRVKLFTYLSLSFPCWQIDNSDQAVTIYIHVYICFRKISLFSIPCALLISSPFFLIDVMITYFWLADDINQTHSLISRRLINQSPFIR
jgi:hypothetical protein